jgi:peptidoglycan hydrolase-like protein with peptidoglycan-binding domain
MSDPKVLETQVWLNATFGSHSQWNHVTEDGFTGWGTIFGLIRGLQIKLGITTLADNFGAGTMNAFITQFGSVGPATTNTDVIKLVQGSLWCKGFSGGYTWGQYDNSVSTSVIQLTAAMGLTPATTVAPKVLKGLMSMDAYSLLPGGNADRRAVQQWLNGKYSGRSAFSILPCDGLYSRNTQIGLVYAIQYEIPMTDAVANGSFGPATKSGIQNGGGVAQGSVDNTKNWVRLFQGALRFNGYSPPFSGTFDAATTAQTVAFQTYAELPTHGSGDYRTWASLLVSNGDETRPGAASDMATQLNTGLSNALYSAGYRVVGRYLTVTSKRYLPGELQTIFNAGLETFPIFQEAGTSAAYFNQAIGQNHAQQAARRLRQLGFPAGTTVFFAVDYDATDDGITLSLVPYFQGVKEYLARTRVPYTIGVYGTRNVCARLINADLAEEAFIASMSWGWSGNLGYKLPPAWSYDQIYNYPLPGTSGYTGSGLNMEIDKNVMSVRANPVGAVDIKATPLIGGAFDRFYWMIAHLSVVAEITGFAVNAYAQNHAVLFYVQGKDSRYLSGAFPIYLPPDETFVSDFPGFATAQESVANETDFIGSFSVPSGTDVGTPHLAVTARGYLKYGRPGISALATVQVADLGGWALDLVTLWTEFAGSTSVSHPATYGVTKSWFEERLGIRDSTIAQGSFSFDDLVGDIDGYLIGSLANDNLMRSIDDVVREIRVNIATNSTWRYSAFYSQRFGSNMTTAKNAAKDAFTSGNLAVGTAVTYFLGGFQFVVQAPYGGGSAGLVPSAAELDAISDVWANLIGAMAVSGAGAAPAA